MTRRVLPWAALVVALIAPPVLQFVSSELPHVRPPRPTYEFEHVCLPLGGYCTMRRLGGQWVGINEHGTIMSEVTDRLWSNQMRFMERPGG